MTTRSGIPARWRIIPQRRVIGETPTSLATLPTDLARELKKPEPTKERVYIRADRTVRYGDFMAVMNTLQGNGYYQVALINEEL